jgi:hypothetical protein
MADQFVDLVSNPNIAVANLFPQRFSSQKYLFHRSFNLRDPVKDFD